MTLDAFDYIIIFVVIFHFSGLISNGLTGITNNYFSGLDLNIIVSHMADASSQGSTSASQSDAVANTRLVKDVYTHGSWPDTVRTIFIYGTGALRYVAKKTPTGKIAVTVGTIAIDISAQAAKRIVDDPHWFGEHLKKFKIIRGQNNNPEELHVEAGDDKEALNRISNSATSVTEGDSTASFLPTNENFLIDNIKIEDFFSYVIQIFKLNPVIVDYPQTLLAEQHQGLALSLFVLSLSAIIIFISLVFSVIFFSLRDRIKSYFKNRYILSYLNLNFKLIVIELSFLSLVLLYDLFYTVKIAHFLFTHPIQPN